MPSGRQLLGVGVLTQKHHSWFQPLSVWFYISKTIHLNCHFSSEASSANTYEAWEVSMTVAYMSKITQKCRETCNLEHLVLVHSSMKPVFYIILCFDSRPVTWKSNASRLQEAYSVASDGLCTGRTTKASQQRFVITASYIDWFLFFSLIRQQ